MPSSDASSKTAQKRKTPTTDPKPPHPPKKPCPDAGAAAVPAPPRAALIGPHEAVIAALSPRHDVLAASIISSSQISKRVRYALSHLTADDGGKDGGSGAETGKKRIVLLHAPRTADVSKMLTVAELCKRTLGEGGRPWHQYNQLFEVPEDTSKSKIEETILPNENGADEEEDEDEDEGAFEPVRGRFEDAVMPPPRARTTKSLRIFLSLESIPDLRAEPGVTVQSSEET